MTDEQEVKPGLVCSKCWCRHFYTIKTIPRRNKIVRVKECRNCKKRVRTNETVAEE